MGLVSNVISNLINGISQQAPSVRLDNQVESQLNMIPEIGGVLTRRNPVELQDIIAHDGSRVYTEEHPMFTMTINEELVSIGIKPDGTVYRFDKDTANTTTINQAASVKTYLSWTDKKQISAIETSDRLLILNRGKTVTLNTSPVASTSTYRRGLIWITSAFNGANYKIWHVDTGGTKTLVGDYTAGSSDTPKSIITALISTAGTNMTAAIPLTKTFHQENNTVIVRNDGLDYFEVECDFGDYIKTIAEYGFNDTKVITDAATLPPKVATGVADTWTPSGTENFTVRVNPDVNEELNTYYLMYSSDYEAWVEVNNRYIDTINNETMPVSIIKDTVTTLDVTHSDFKTPQAGDNGSNPQPSFVGKKIKDIVIFNARLGFASENTLVFSVIDEHLNVYRTTTAANLIADSVDIELDSSKLGFRTIDNIFTLDNNILINTGLSQSILAIPQNLDISGAVFAQVSSFDLGTNPPIPVRRSMYFNTKQGSFTKIKAFAPDLATGTGYTDNPINKHCEQLIKGGQLQGLFTNDIYIMRTDDDPKTLYIQHSYVLEGELKQNAWHKWSFAYNIKYIYESGESLEMVFEDMDNNQTIYGTLDLNPAEIAEDTSSQIGYKPYLDFKTEDTSLAALLDNTISVDKSLGKLVPVGSPNSIQGINFVSSVELSEITPRRFGSDGKATKLGYTILMLRRMSVTLGYSGRLKIDVTRAKRSTYEHNFVPKLLGDVVVGREPVNTRDAKFPINGRSQDVTITIRTENTFTPLQIRSVEWQGQVISQSGR